MSVEMESLDLQGVIGFNGAVRNAFIIHPMDQHVLYPLGSTIVLRHLTENTQTFLQKGGHDNDVSCMALSSSGKYLASGQETHMGFDAEVIIWDLETYQIKFKLMNHKGRIQALAFSPDEQFLATLGGRDDNNLVVWNVETGQPICGAPASTETAQTLKWYNNSNNMLVTGGNNNLRVWSFDERNRKLKASDVNLGGLHRVVVAIVIAEDDSFMYCGTSTGDILKVRLGSGSDNYNFHSSTAGKDYMANGVKALTMTRLGDLIAGSGDGTVFVIDPETLKPKRGRKGPLKQKFAGSISSLVLNAAQDHFFVATERGNIFLAHKDTLEKELRFTCHYGKINDVAFPQNYSDLFATCSKNDIRVWHARTRNELLRIQVPNLECLCVSFSPDGGSIVSGWSDGKIRAFKPQSGGLQYAINDAHIDGVTALAVIENGAKIVSGGATGHVRVWRLNKHHDGMWSHTMEVSLKEHKNTVNSICVNAQESECVTSSSDGSCILWDLKRFVRQQVLFANTQFRYAIYHPDQTQLLTCGTDHKLTYWDAASDPNAAANTPIRMIDGSEHPISTLDISSDGSAIVSAGSDKTVKVWGYDEGYQYVEGVGHSGEVTSCKIAPDQKTIVTVGTEGAIFLWTMPKLMLDDGEGDAGVEE